MVQVTSAGYEAGNFAKISINNKVIPVETNEHGHDRGLHIVVLNPSTGAPELAKAFDTFKRPDYFDHFIKGAKFPDGYIILAACKDDCFASLSYKAKLWFSGLGSKEIWKLQYR